MYLKMLVDMLIQISIVHTMYNSYIIYISLILGMYCMCMHMCMYACACACQWCMRGCVHERICLYVHMCASKLHVYVSGYNYAHCVSIRNIDTCHPFSCATYYGANVQEPYQENMLIVCWLFSVDSRKIKLKTEIENVFHGIYPPNNI